MAIITYTGSDKNPWSTMIKCIQICVSSLGGLFIESGGRRVKQQGEHPQPDGNVTLTTSCASTAIDVGSMMVLRLPITDQVNKNNGVITNTYCDREAVMLKDQPKLYMSIVDLTPSRFLAIFVSQSCKHYGVFVIVCLVSAHCHIQKFVI